MEASDEILGARDGGRKLKFIFFAPRARPARRRAINPPGGEASRGRTAFSRPFRGSPRATFSAFAAREQARHPGTNDIADVSGREGNAIISAA